MSEDLTEKEVEEFLQEVIRSSGLLCELDLPDIPSGRRMPFKITEGMRNPKPRKVKDIY